jgi:hypothetical protein
MSVFQTIVLTVFGVLALLTFSAGLRGYVRKRIVFFWLLIWIFGSVAIVWPRSTMLLARWLGIGRGADLLLYVSVLATLVGFFYIYTRFRRMDRQMTLLVRRLAIDNALPPSAAVEAPAETRT